MNDKTRREFLRDCYKIGGYAALVSLGSGAINDALGYGLLPAISGRSSTSWSGWDELSEAGLASSDTFVAMEENINAGGNETGNGGGLIGTNLALTDVGSVDGASGSPPTRVNDALSGQTWPLAAMNTMFNTNTWTLLFKANVTSVGIHQYWCVLGAGEAGQNGITIYFYSDNLFTVTTYQNGNAESKSSGAIAATGIQWAAAWAKNGVMKAGIATTRPTKESDFSTVLTFLVNTGDMSAGSFASNKTVWNHPTPLNGLVGSLYYMVASKLCFF